MSTFADVEYTVDGKNNLYCLVLFSIFQIISQRDSAISLYIIYRFNCYIYQDSGYMICVLVPNKLYKIIVYNINLTIVPNKERKAAKHNH